MAYRDPQADLVGQPLEFHFPQSASAPVGTATVGCDEELLRIRVDPTPHLPPPSPQRLDSELGRVVIDPDTNPARVGGLVVDAVGDGFASSLSLKSWTFTFSGFPLGRHSRPPLRNWPTSSFFLVSTDTTGCPSLRNALTLRLMYWNWASRSG